MARLLFLTWYGAGNQGPSIALARELIARGHEVVVAGYAGQRETFAERGLDLVVLPRVDARYAREQSRGDVFGALATGVWACPEHLEDVPEVVAATGCDGVVVDCLMLGALAALEGGDLPVAVLVHSAPGAMAPPGGPLEAQILGALDGVRSRAGQPPLTRLWDAWAPFATLVASIPELDPLAADVPPSFAFVGPVLDDPTSPTWRSPWPDDDSRPLVVASFSTGHAWDQTSRIERTLRALDGRPFRVLALTGTADVAGLGTLPANGHVRPFVPHGQVLPDAAVVVTHAGHGTVCAALTHGVPMVCLPNPAADQPALAEQLDRLGAGIALDGENASREEIGAAVVAATGAQMRAAAAGLADRITSAPGAPGAADRVEAMLSR